jgi:hypothetical protein
MSAPEPQHSTPGPDDRATESGAGGRGDPPEGTPKKHRSAWVWVSAGLAVIAVGLLVWALTVQSDLDSTEEDVQDLQAQVENESEAGDAATSVARTLSDELGATEEDLAATEQQLDAAEDDAAQADEAAAKAKQAADTAENATDKAQAEADQAQAEADAATSRAEIAGECARAYVGAFGTLFEGEGASSQAASVREELQGITAQCKSALAGE